MLDPHLRPLTYSIGFLELPAEQLAHEISTFFARVYSTGQVTEVSGPVEHMLETLQPLTNSSRPDFLVVPIALPGWAALFDSDADGQGVREIASLLAADQQVRGYFVDRG